MLSQKINSLNRKKEESSGQLAACIVCRADFESMSADACLLARSRSVCMSASSRLTHAWRGCQAGYVIRDVQHLIKWLCFVNGHACFFRGIFFDKVLEELLLLYVISGYGSCFLFCFSFDRAFFCLTERIQPFFCLRRGKL